MKSLQQEHPPDDNELGAESSDDPEVTTVSTEVPIKLIATRTSSGRLVKTPARYRDFILKLN